MGLAPEVVAAIATRLAERAGLELPAWVVEARAAARMDACELAPDAYVELIGSGRGAAELDELIEAVRVGESRLFRHRSQIAALVDAVVPALRARGKRTIKVWSAGCAAGEEPYTLASVLSRAGFEPQITATDVSADALALAARASYPASAWNDIPSEWRDDFVFEEDPQRVTVRPHLVELVRFERLNLADATTTQKNCDLVWCRNVLIYFTPTARRRVIDRLVSATVPGGFLFVGYSEHLRDIPELEAVRAGDAVYYVRREHDRRTPALGVPLRDSAPAMPAARAKRDTAEQRAAMRTPPPVLIPKTPPAEDVLVLHGHPSARVVTAELMARLGIAGLQTLVVDLDSAELLGDDLAPVLRRARAAARAAHVELAIRATRTGAKRWLARHALDEEAG